MSNATQPRPRQTPSKPRVRHADGPPKRTPQTKTTNRRPRLPSNRSAFMLQKCVRACRNPYGSRRCVGRRPTDAMRRAGYGRVLAGKARESAEELIIHTTMSRSGDERRGEEVMPSALFSPPKTPVTIVKCCPSHNINDCSIFHKCQPCLSFPPTTLSHYQCHCSRPVHTQK